MVALPALVSHRAIKLTMDVYCHWIPGAKKSAVDGLDNVDYLNGVNVVNENQ